MQAITTSRRRATPLSFATSSGRVRCSGSTGTRPRSTRQRDSLQIRKPDGVQDSIQQIRHGTLQLLAQYKAFGHAIVGIVDPTLQQYTHLGDAGSQTDGRLYDPRLGPNDTKGDKSGVPDDRWAFTTDLPANDLVVAAALAGASRTLHDSDPKLAADALALRRRCGRRSGQSSAPMPTRATGAAAPGCCRLPMPRRASSC